MGGWFNKEVNSSADFKGLRYRMPGARRRGFAPHGRYRRDHPRRRNLTALKSGAIDASE